MKACVRLIFVKRNHFAWINDSDITLFVRFSCGCVGWERKPWKIELIRSFVFSFQLLETLKAENQRLKDENGALIRVISKLSK